MLKTLGAQIKEFKKDSVLTPVFMIGEVIMETIIPLLMASIIDNGVGGIDKFGNNDVAGHCYALIASLTGNYGKRGTGCGIYG